MAEETAPQSPEASKDALDLNSLSGLDFGPNWADGKPSRSSGTGRAEDHGARKSKGRRPAAHSTRDRRSGGRPPARRGEQNEKRGAHGKRDFGRGPSVPEFDPVVKVDLYPQDEAFDALVKRLRASARTYQLFEIAHLLLEKPERYVVLVAKKQKKSDDKEAKPLLYYSVPGHLPFESEEEAISHVLKEHIDLFFDIEEIEVDPPTGNFQMVSRCGITGDLLGPPNYHRYQEFLQRHYAAKISGMSFERFQSKIVASKEQEDIDTWIESMRKGARYTVKDRKEDEPESFDTLEAARLFLLKHRKDQVLGSGESVRFAGRDIERLPKGPIRRAVESYVEQQKHFPLDSANNIRGRLRRHKFAVYKKGSKGISFVCAVKRKFRDGKTVFTDSIRDLIDFIEKHPEIPASKLSKEYIGIDTEKQSPEALKMKEVAPEEGAPPEEKASPEEVAPSEEKASPEEKSSSEETPPQEQAAEETQESTPAEVVDEAVDTAETEPPVTKEASTQATPKSALSDEEQATLNQLMLDLRWLITEGYVTEYGDGRLFAPAPLPEPSNKNKAPELTKPEKAAESTEVPTPETANAPTDAPTADETADETADDETPDSTKPADTAPVDEAVDKAVADSNESVPVASDDVIQAESEDDTSEDPPKNTEGS